MNVLHRIFISVVFLCSVGTEYAQTGIDKGPEVVKEEILPYKNPSLPIEVRLEDLMGRMTLEEKVGQMIMLRGGRSEVRSEHLTAQELIDPEILKKYSDDDVLQMVSHGMCGTMLQVFSLQQANLIQAYARRSRLGIPVLVGTDAIHGNGYTEDSATIFATPIGQASSFDLDMVNRISAATAREMRATGEQWNFSPYAAITRDPRWGRMAEIYGEDVLLNTRMVETVIDGLQYQNELNWSVGACSKVFVAEGASEGGRNQARVSISERDLWTHYMPQFKTSIEHNVYSIMIAHHELNGVPCHMHKELVRNLLKDKWGLKGFIVSDWNDVHRGLIFKHAVSQTEKHSTNLALKAGIDSYMLGKEYFPILLELGQESPEALQYIDQSVRRILWVKFKLELFENDFTDPQEAEKILRQDSHLELALESARKSIVLLKNQSNLLPLSTEYQKILVAGPNADHAALLGDWVISNHEAQTVTILDGMKKHAPKGVEIVSTGCGDILNMSDEDIERAVEQARQCDVAVVAVGSISLRSYKAKAFCGENRDRASLQLYGRQKEMIQKIHAIGIPVVVVLVNGRSLAVEWCDNNIPSIINAWEPGERGGDAIAEVIFGKYNPSGRLPVTIPRSVGQVPIYYNCKPSSFVVKYKDISSEPLYPFGHGLSYTTFEYSKLTFPDLIKKDEDVKVSVTITNTGKRDGDKVALVFVRDVVSSLPTPVKSLKAFNRVSLKAGESKSVEMTIPFSSLGFYDVDMNWVVEPGNYDIMVGPLRGTFIY